MFIFGLFLGNPHLKNEKKSQSADNKQNFEILVPLRAKHLKPHNNRLTMSMLQTTEIRKNEPNFGKRA